VKQRTCKGCEAKDREIERLWDLVREMQAAKTIVEPQGAPLMTELSLGELDPGETPPAGAVPLQSIRDRWAYWHHGHTEPLKIYEET
jgi:hypothetical protein